MRTALSSLEILQPRSLDEALRTLREDGPLVPIAGCTDVYVTLEFGIQPARRFLNVWGLDELRGFSTHDGILRLGALTTYTEIRNSPEVREWLPMLAAAASEIGGVQIQNRGTLAGNIANGSPAGDTLPVLAAADAVVVLRSTTGERRVPLTGLYTGYRATVIRPDELIASVEIPPVRGQQWFRKVGTRAAQAISKVVIAAVRAPSPRIALGSVAATVVRLPATEACLAAGGSIEEAQQLLRSEIHPIDDVRSTAEYRLRVAANLLEQWWKETG
ncbi:MAG: FAD binding domain-containing protein [Gemmatimonadetes bacterium]|nr:FAD binding domain-containing protein [Gemmatimonadota bacterium]